MNEIQALIAGAFRWTFDQISPPIVNALGQLTGSLQDWVGPKFKLCVLAYFLVTLLIAAWSQDEAAFSRFFRQLCLASIIYSLAVTAGDFNYYVDGGFNGLTNGISTAIGGLFGGAPAPGAGTADLFDKIDVKSLAVGVEVFKSLSWTSPKTVILALCVIPYWFITVMTNAYVFVLYLSSLLITKFVIAFGPLFIACYFFPATRFLFDGWLGVVLGGILTQIFTVGWLAVFSLVMTANLTRVQAAASLNRDDVVGTVVAMILSIVLVEIFAALTTISAYFAIRIAGGAHTSLEAARAPAPSPEPAPSPAPAAPEQPAGASAPNQIRHVGAAI